jgi:hypothetical protein
MPSSSSRFPKQSGKKPDRSMPRHLINAIRSQKLNDQQLGKKEAKVQRFMNNVRELKRPFGSAGRFIPAT